MQALCYSTCFHHARRSGKWYPCVLLSNSILSYSARIVQLVNLHWHPLVIRTVPYWFLEL